MSDPISIQQDWKGCHKVKLDNNYIEIDDLKKMTDKENIRRGQMNYDSLKLSDGSYVIPKTLNKIKINVDDIIFGLPNDTPVVGTNYYKVIGDCEYFPLEKEEVEEEDGSFIYKDKVDTRPPKKKWAYIRTKPTGKTLYKLGIGDKNVTDKGLLFSMVEDILDLNPLNIYNMSKNPPKDLLPGTFKNCRTTKKVQETGIKYYDDNLVEIKKGDKSQIPYPTEKNIEMFQNLSNKDYLFNKDYLINIIINISLISIIFFILYKLQ